MFREEFFYSASYSMLLLYKVATLYVANWIFGTWFAEINTTHDENMNETITTVPCRYDIREMSALETRMAINHFKDSRKA